MGQLGRRFDSVDELIELPSTELTRTIRELEAEGLTGLSTDDFLRIPVWMPNTFEISARRIRLLVDALQLRAQEWMQNTRETSQLSDTRSFLWTA
jgi:hypothetical protein